MSCFNEDGGTGANWREGGELCRRGGEGRGCDVSRAIGQ